MIALIIMEDNINVTKSDEKIEIIYCLSCAECGMPVNDYPELYLCDFCAEGKIEEEMELGEQYR
jgi:hypothetical protein